MTQDWIASAGQPLRGTLDIPGDKSVSHRAVMFAALADGTSTIDGFLEGINAGLDVLGIEKRVPLIGMIELGGIENPFAGAAANAGAEARVAFEAAFNSDPIAPPDLALTAAAEAARGAKLHVCAT